METKVYTLDNNSWYTKTKATLNAASQIFAPYSSSAWPKNEVLFNLRAKAPSAQSKVPFVKTINNPR